MKGILKIQLGQVKRWNYSYESVWGSQTALTANLTYNTEDEYESKY